MSFARKTLLGLQQVITSLKSWCNNRFALLGHTHSEFATQGITLTKRYTTVTHGISWIVEEYSDNYVVMRAASLVDRSKSGSVDNLVNYIFFVYLPVTMKDTKYQINVTPRTKIGLFSLGSGLCGYGMALEGTTAYWSNNATYKQCKSYTNKFTLLSCWHFSSYDVIVSGYKAV